MIICKKGGGEGSFLGFIGIEVNGKFFDYDLFVWDGQFVMIDLGLDVRFVEEFVCFVDKWVVVEGILMLDFSFVDGLGLGVCTKLKFVLVGFCNI